MFKREVYVYKNGNTIALAMAHSKEEAMCIFKRLYDYQNPTGDMISKATLNQCDVEVIKNDES